MKTAHIADLHQNPERHKKVMRILDHVEEVAPDVDVITNSGENFNNTYTMQQVLREFLDKLGNINSITPMATVEATQGHHEKKGMIELIELVGVKKLVMGVEYFLSNGKIIESNTDVYPELLLYGSPHPTATKVLADNKGLSLEQANAIVNKSMAQYYTKYGAMRSRYPNVKSLMVGHGVIQGEKTRNLHAIKNSSIYSTEEEIKQAMADFYAWGHYHIPTEFKNVLGGYLGSFAWSYNELDYKPSITIVDWDTMKVEKIPVDVNVKKKLWMFPEGELPEISKGSGCFTEIPDVKVVMFG